MNSTFDLHRCELQYNQYVEIPLFVWTRFKWVVDKIQNAFITMHVYTLYITLFEKTSYKPGHQLFW